MITDQHRNSLAERIDAARERGPGGKRTEDGVVGQAHVVWRMVIDLVAGVGCGAAIGYGADQVMGSAPIMIVTLTLVGFAAGIRLVMREAARLDAGER